MYSKRSPPTVPAGIEFPNISMPGMCGIAPSTGINRSRRYSSIFETMLVSDITWTSKPSGPRRRHNSWHNFPRRARIVAEDAQAGQTVSGLEFAHCRRHLLSDDGQIVPELRESPRPAELTI